MPSTTPLTDAINALTTYANTVTGQNDPDLSSAVATLAAGYGGGGGVTVATGTVTPAGTSNTLIIDVGVSNIQNFIILPAENPFGRGARYSVGNISLSSGFYYQSLRIPMNSTGAAMNAPTGYTDNTSFTQSGTVVTVTTTWNFGPFEYRWLAW